MVGKYFLLRTDHAPRTDPAANCTPARTQRVLAGTTKFLLMRSGVVHSISAYRSHKYRSRLAHVLDLRRPMPEGTVHPGSTSMRETSYLEVQYSGSNLKWMPPKCLPRGSTLTRKPGVRCPSLGRPSRSGVGALSQNCDLHDSSYLFTARRNVNRLVAPASCSARGNLVNQSDATGFPFLCH